MFSNFLLFGSLIFCSSAALASGVKVLHDPSKPDVGPFPTDYLTAPATNTKTARMVRMPMPADCNAQPNACQEAWLLQNFDGFNPQARARVRFSGRINENTIKDGIYLVARENLASGEPGIHKMGDIIRLNQIVYDPVTNTAYGKPDTAMDQHRRYLLVVTTAVKDAAGDAVEPDAGFTACSSAADEYCSALTAAIRATSTAAPIAGGSLYSTMSATAWLEKARDALPNTPPELVIPPSANFLKPTDVRTMIFHQETGVDRFADFDFPISLLQNIVSGIGFGAYTSPSYLGPDRTIAPQASAEDLPPAPSAETIHFQTFLPGGPKPANGFPVVIMGPGLGDTRFGGPSVVAYFMASYKTPHAVIAINAVGHGFGPNSSLQLTMADGSRADLPTPGRGVDVDGDGKIGEAEGCLSVVSSPLGFRDCTRQTVVDLMQLVRLIKTGLDIDGDGTPDLDPDNIYYVGQSLGAMYGTMFMVLEPSVKKAVLNSGGGSMTEISRWSRTLSSITAQNLGLRFPSLLNRAGGFDEDYVLRDKAPKVLSVAGAADIQNTFETLEWLQAEGDPAAYAPHLKASPLESAGEKSVLFQFAYGDATVPNPAQSTLVRYSGLTNALWFYRDDLVRKVSPALPQDPHTYLTNLDALPITRAVQSQIAAFFTGESYDPNSDVRFFINLIGSNLFEQPVSLPEELNFLEP